MRSTLLLLFMALCLGDLHAPAAPATRPPNIIFILADDLGWRDLGCYGSTFYETPNLDRLATGAMRFTQAYAACCVCSPTRASILTGKYPARLGLTDWLPGRGDRPDQKLKRPILPNHLPLEEVTFAEALKDSGYKTAFVGKWHLGGQGFLPENQGFDLNVGGCELGHPPSYFSPYKIPGLADGPKGEYLTDRLTDEALKFIESSKAGPFLLYLSHYTVHNPQQAKPEMIQHFKDKLAKHAPGRGPEFLPERATQARQIQDQPVYAAMVQSLDESVGRVLQKLKETNLEDNTIVVFFSDNGGLSTAEGAPTSNIPLRAGKGWLYEGGIREPLLVRWPGVTRARSLCHDPVLSTDFYPTFLEAAGLPLRPEQHQDGVSLVPLLKGERVPERTLFWHYPHYSNQGVGPCAAIRRGNLKLIQWYEDLHIELYDLKKDLGEKHDLALEKPAVASELRNRLQTWRQELKAAMPTPNPDYQGR